MLDDMAHDELVLQFLIPAESWCMIYCALLHRFDLCMHQVDGKVIAHVYVVIM